MTELRPAQQSPDWDPTLADPLWPEEWEREYELERAYADRKPGVSRAVLVWGFVALVVILAILAAALLVAAPRETTDAGNRTRGLESAERSRDAGVRMVRPVEDGARLAASRSAVGGGGDSGGTSTPPAVLPDTSTSVSGTASWYCGGGSACTRGYPPGTLAAAAGPALRVGDWRGRIVKVCGNGKCVRVILADWCACPRRVIDLYRSAFSRLANPSRGLLRVSITWGGSTVVLPPTDTQ